MGFLPPPEPLLPAEVEAVLSMPLLSVTTGTRRTPPHVFGSAERALSLHVELKNPRF